MKHDKGLWHQMQSAIVWVTWFDKRSIMFSSFLIICQIFSKTELLHFECVALGGSWDACPLLWNLLSANLQQVAKMTCNLVSTPHFDTVWPPLWKILAIPLLLHFVSKIVTIHVKSCYVFVLMLHIVSEVVKLFCISCPILWHDRVTNYEWHNLVDWTLCFEELFVTMETPSHMMTEEGVHDNMQMPAVK